MFLKRLKDALRRPPKPGLSFGRLIATVAGGLAVAGVVVYAVVFYPLMEGTNSTEFCISCHSMQATVYQEYKQSAHYSNAMGVRAGCPDCHVPKQFGPKLVAKIRAAKDVWHEMLGTIDTPEKFEAHRWRMASAVWAMMERTDSSTCRSCHSFESMNLDAQDRLSARRHRSAMADGKTCIACHKALVHKRPRPPGSDAPSAGSEPAAANGSAATDSPAAAGSGAGASDQPATAAGAEPAQTGSQPAPAGAGGGPEGNAGTDSKSTQSTQ